MKTKKLWSMLIVLAMVLSLLPATVIPAFAEESAATAELQAATAEGGEIAASIAENSEKGTKYYNYYSAASLEAALKEGRKGNDAEDGAFYGITLTLYADMSLPEMDYSGNHAMLEVNLHGHTLTLTGTRNYTSQEIRLYDGIIDFDKFDVTHSENIFNLGQVSNNYAANGLRLENVTFQNAKAGRFFNIMDVGDNGGYYFTVDGVTFKDSSFSDYGGAFWINKSKANPSIIFENCNFINLHSSRSGGAIYVKNMVGNGEQGASIFMNKCNFMNCSTDGEGGAIYIYEMNASSGKPASIDTLGCNFLNCTSENDGGAIFVDDEYIRLGYASDYGYSAKALFYNCSAKRYGGAVYFDDNDGISCQNMVFVGNKAYDSEWGGGAIHVFCDDASVSDCEFYLNNGAGYGGAVSVDADDASFTNCVFAGNESAKGKDIYVGSNKDKPAITGCTVYRYDSVNSLRRGGSGIGEPTQNTFDPSVMKFNFDNYNAQGELIKGDSNENPINIIDTKDMIALAVNIKLDPETYAGRYYRLAYSLGNICIPVRDFTGEFDFDGRNLSTRLNDMLFDNDVVLIAPDVTNVFGWKEDYTVRRIAETGDCTTPGHIACYLRVTDGMYFEDKKCTIKIGDETAFAAWCAEGGKGYLAYRHIDDNNDGSCDICGEKIHAYMEYYGLDEGFVKRYIPTKDVTEINTSSDDLTLTEGWYIVTKDVTINNRISTSGNIRLILQNGKKLTMKKGIRLTGFLMVYAQTTDTSKMGELTATFEKADEWDRGCACIGSDNNGACGSIIINGGIITATSDSRTVIGSGAGNAMCGDIIINGGIVTATAKGDEYHGCAIGGSSEGSSSFRSLIINGGTVTATGGGRGVGIGGWSPNGVTINGGNVTATGGSGFAGIGKNGMSGCSVTINGGTVTATGGGGFAALYGYLSINPFLIVKAGTDKNNAKVVPAYRNEPYVFLNGEKLVGKNPICTASGYKTPYKNSANGFFYEEDTFETKIGTFTDLTGWALYGKGRLAPVANHPGWEYIDAVTHRCTLCGTMQAHSSGCNDSFCDNCGCEFVNFVRGNIELPIDVQSSPFVSMEMGFAPFEYTGSKTIANADDALWRFFNYEGGSTFDVGDETSSRGYMRVGCEEGSKLNLGERYDISFGCNTQKKAFLSISQNGVQKYHQEKTTSDNIAVGQTDVRPFMSDMALHYCKVYRNDALVRNLVPKKDEQGNLGLYDMCTGNFYTGNLTTKTTKYVENESGGKAYYCLDDGIYYLDCYCTKKVPVIHYVGDYEDTVFYNEETFALPVCPDEGYCYAFLLNGDPWDGKTIPGDNLTVVVKKVKVHEEEVFCHKSGHKIYYEYGGEYFTDLHCISKIEDLTAWLSKGGDGYIAPEGIREKYLGHDVIAVRDNVYYGYNTKNAKASKWRVLSTNGNPEGGNWTTYTDDNGEFVTERLFVISENNFGVMRFFSTQSWANSDVRRWCQGDFYTAAGITTEEKAGIVTTSKSDKDVTISDIAFGTCNLSDKAFLISASEAKTYFVDPEDRMFAPGGGAVEWKLRSPSKELKEYVGGITGYGFIDLYTVLSQSYVRPAFNLNSTNVLFTAAVTGGDNAPAGGVCHDWKVTLKDESRNFAAESVNRNGNVLTIEYSGAKTAADNKNEKISYIITDKDKQEIKYYDFQKATTESGSMEITLPDSMDATDRLFVFNEQINGDYKTDYASELQEITIPDTKNALSIEVNGNEFTVTATGEDAGHGVIAVALYDSEKCENLLDIKIFDIEKGDIPTGAFTQSGYVKAYWWSALDAANPMNPYCNPANGVCIIEN